MVSENYLTLNQLNKKRSYHRIVVRFTRKWEARNLSKNNELIGIIFFLFDEKVNIFIFIFKKSYIVLLLNIICLLYRKIPFKVVYNVL